jgi:hypothetical protein
MQKTFYIVVNTETGEYVEKIGSTASAVTYTDDVWKARQYTMPRYALDYCLQHQDCPLGISTLTLTASVSEVREDLVQEAVDKRRREAKELVDRVNAMTDAQYDRLSKDQRARFKKAQRELLNEITDGRREIGKRLAQVRRQTVKM